jgi:hypothetical protein
MTMNTSAFVVVFIEANETMTRYRLVLLIQVQWGVTYDLVELVQ